MLKEMDPVLRKNDYRWKYGYSKVSHFCPHAYELYSFPNFFTSLSISFPGKLPLKYENL